MWGSLILFCTFSSNKISFSIPKKRGKKPWTWHGFAVKYKDQLENECHVWEPNWKWVPCGGTKNIVTCRDKKCSLHFTMPTLFYNGNKQRKWCWKCLHVWGLNWKLFKETKLKISVSYMDWTTNIFWHFLFCSNHIYIVSRRFVGCKAHGNEIFLYHTFFSNNQFLTFPSM